MAEGEMSRKIGVDLDGTLAFWDGWVKWSVIGRPIEPMADRVRQWIAEGHDVVIFTARMHEPTYPGAIHKCRTSGELWRTSDMAQVIGEWTFKHVGRRLRATAVKEIDMAEFWDDRAVQVEPNTGRTLADAHAAELSALRGAP